MSASHINGHESIEEKISSKGSVVWYSGGPYMGEEKSGEPLDCLQEKTPLSKRSEDKRDIAGNRTSENKAKKRSATLNHCTMRYQADFELAKERGTRREAHRAEGEIGNEGC